MRPLDFIEADGCRGILDAWLWATRVSYEYQPSKHSNIQTSKQPDQHPSEPDSYSHWQ